MLRSLNEKVREWNLVRGGKEVTGGWRCLTQKYLLPFEGDTSVQLSTWRRAYIRSNLRHVCFINVLLLLDCSNVQISILKQDLSIEFGSTCEGHQLRLQTERLDMKLLDSFHLKQLCDSWFPNRLSVCRLKSLGEGCKVWSSSAPNLGKSPKHAPMSAGFSSLNEMGELFYCNIANWVMTSCLILILFRFTNRGVLWLRGVTRVLAALGDQQ